MPSGLWDLLDERIPAPLAVSPDAQVTTNAYVDVAGSTLDTLKHKSVSYTLLENNVNAIKWKLLASNDAAFAVSVEAQAEAVVNKAASASYSAAVAVWRYFKVQITANVGDSQGSATVHGVAKG